VPNLGLGIGAGLVAAVVAAVVWGGFTGITHYRVGILSLAVGAFIGWAMVKAAGGRATEIGIAAAIITVLACAVGDIATIYIEAMHKTGASLGDLMRIEGPFGVLKNDLSDDKLGIVFFAIAAFYAFKHGSVGPSRGSRQTPAQPGPPTAAGPPTAESNPGYYASESRPSDPAV